MGKKITIDETTYGYRMTFDGFMKLEDVQAWAEELPQVVAPKNGGFGVLVDMRGAAAFPVNAQEALFGGIHYCANNGTERIAVVVANPITKMQSVRIAREAGIADRVRFVDASTLPDWERRALDWIRRGADPDA